jgi:hypothetical protein
MMKKGKATLTVGIDVYSRGEGEVGDGKRWGA